MNYGILYLGVAVFVGLFLFTFRSGITDYVYLAVKNWKHTVFIVVCIMGGLFMGAYAAHLDSFPDVSGFSLSLSKKKEDNTIAIRHCREFVAARMDGKTEGAGDDAPESGGLFGPASRWDECAALFGNNFWKYDISVHGENGGQVLCRLYKQSDYQSADVDSWCATVFAPSK